MASRGRKLPVLSPTILRISYRNKDWYKLTSKVIKNTFKMNMWKIIQNIPKLKVFFARIEVWFSGSNWGRR
ncbi:hypothetical protein SNEBB_008015 [Seison nebaliae]|nr:hypothetical protein SNEBB_008015 [Seison nebaliae]